MQLHFKLCDLTYLYTGKTDVQWVKKKLGHLDEGPGGINPGPLHWCYPCCGLHNIYKKNQYGIKFLLQKHL